MLKTNVEKLIKISVMGEIASPTIRSVYNVSATGKALVLPGVGGITYNFYGLATLRADGKQTM